MAVRLYIQFESPEVEQKVVGEVLGVDPSTWERLAQWEHDLRVAMCSGDSLDEEYLYDQLHADPLMNQVYNYKLFGLNRVVPPAYACVPIEEEGDYICGSAEGEAARKMLMVQADHCVRRNYLDNWLRKLVERPEVQGCYWC